MARVTKRILIIDDEQAILHAVARYFTRIGFEVDCACELEEAEALVAHCRYDLVIADLALSDRFGTEGLEIVRYIHHSSPRTRIVLLTGHGSPAVEREALRRGCDRMLYKPKPLLELAKIAVELTGSAA
jgi:DNA-binding response OmpR family regulator